MSDRFGLNHKRIESLTPTDYLGKTNISPIPETENEQDEKSIIYLN